MMNNEYLLDIKNAKQTIGIIGTGNLSEQFVQCLNNQNWMIDKIILFDIISYNTNTYFTGNISFFKRQTHAQTHAQTRAPAHYVILYFSKAYFLYFSPNTLPSISIYKVIIVLYLETDPTSDIFVTF